MMHGAGITGWIVERGPKRFALCGIPGRCGTIDDHVVDVLEGAAIGQNMLALGVVVTLAGLMYQRLRVFTLAQQVSVVFVLAGIHQLIVQWLQGLQGLGIEGFRFLFPALTSAFLWPLVMPVLRSVRRSFRVL